jgi:hypothetical protein
MTLYRPTQRTALEKDAYAGKCRLLHGAADKTPYFTRKSLHRLPGPPVIRQITDFRTF